MTCLFSSPIDPSNGRMIGKNFWSARNASRVYVQPHQSRLHELREYGPSCSSPGTTNKMSSKRLRKMSEKASQARTSDKTHTSPLRAFWKQTVASNKGVPSTTNHEEESSYFRPTSIHGDTLSPVVGSPSMLIPPDFISQLVPIEIPNNALAVQSPETAKDDTAGTRVMTVQPRTPLGLSQTLERRSQVWMRNATGTRFPGRFS